MKVTAQRYRISANRPSGARTVSERRASGEAMQGWRALTIRRGEKRRFLTIQIYIFLTEAMQGNGESRRNAAAFWRSQSGRGRLLEPAHTRHGMPTNTRHGMPINWGGGEAAARGCRGERLEWRVADKAEAAAKRRPQCPRAGAAEVAGRRGRGGRCAKRLTGGRRTAWRTLTTYWFSGFWGQSSQTFPRNTLRGSC